MRLRDPAAFAASHHARLAPRERQLAHVAEDPIADQITPGVLACRLAVRAAQNHVLASHGSQAVPQGAALVDLPKDSLAQVAEGRQPKYVGWHKAWVVRFWGTRVRRWDIRGLLNAKAKPRAPPS
jgi:hypothetical protein